MSVVTNSGHRSYSRVECIVRFEIFVLTVGRQAACAGERECGARASLVCWQITKFASVPRAVPNTRDPIGNGDWVPTATTVPHRSRPTTLPRIDLGAL